MNSQRINVRYLILIVFSLSIFYGCEDNCSEKCESWQECNIEFDICLPKDGKCATKADCLDNSLCDETTHLCVKNKCKPNPCKEANKTVCTATDSSYNCSCITDYKEEGGNCVAICKADSCTKEHQVCKVEGENFSCICEDGYQLIGDNCIANCKENAHYDEATSVCICDDRFILDRDNNCVDDNKTYCDESPCYPETFVASCSSIATYTRCVQQTEGNDCYTLKEETCFVNTKCVEKDNAPSCVHDECLTTCDTNNFTPYCEDNIAYQNCEEFVEIRELCERVTCSYHGNCIPENGTEKCNCDAGYTESGLNCIKDGEEDPCDNSSCNGICQFEYGNERCITPFICNRPTREYCEADITTCTIMNEEAVCKEICSDVCSPRDTILGCSDDSTQKITGCVKAENGCYEYVMDDCPENTHCQHGHIEDASICVPDNADGCHDNIDNDGDGWIDSKDPDCKTGNTERGFTSLQCNDNIDNDRDGLADRDDPDCVDGNDTLEFN